MYKFQPMRPLYGRHELDTVIKQAYQKTGLGLVNQLPLPH